MTRTRRMIFLFRDFTLSVPLRLLIGATLVFSGATKLSIHSRFVDIVNSYQLLPHSLATAYALALPWAELVIGAYLLLGILVRPSALVAVLMGISFTVVNISTIIRGEKQCLSCFGEAIILSVWQSLAIDVLIIIAGLYVVVAAGKRQTLSFDNWFAKRQRDKAAISGKK
jgi:putative oxidoreductase